LQDLTPLVLTTGNKEAEQDRDFFAKLGIRPEKRPTPSSRRVVNA